jgi:hypothetical protein
MKESNNVKLVVHVPLSHADVVRNALGESGAGIIGEYSHCSFTVRGKGRYMGGPNSNPAIGEKGTYEIVEEESIEVVVPKDLVKVVMKAVREVHPYEEIAPEIYPLLDL